MRFSVALHCNSMPHQKEHMKAMLAGMKRHGLAPIMEAYNLPTTCDIEVVWGWRQKNIILRCKAENRPLLVMERGFVGDRLNKWSSAGFNGLNGRATFPKCQDDGERFYKYFGEFLKPWHRNGKYAVIMGQVEGDASIETVNIGSWYLDIAGKLKDAGFDTLFRPHPLSPGTRIPGVKQAKGSLRDVLDSAKLVATYNSNSGVDAALAGIPVYVQDMAGSIAAPVASNRVEVTTPDRSQWCRDLAWKQWTMDQIANGDAWSALKTCLD